MTFDGMNREAFDAGWRRMCSVMRVSVAQLDDLMRRHYLGTRPGVVPCALAMLYGPLAVGMVVFAEAPRETSKRYGGKTWELARLWVQDAVPRNAESWLIARAIHYVRDRHPDVTCLVSYADPSQGHTGTVYKAANWKADGMTDAERKSPRCDYLDPANGKRYSRRSHVPDDATVVRVPRVRKYRFIYPLEVAHDAQGS